LFEPAPTGAAMGRVIQRPCRDDRRVEPNVVPLGPLSVRTRLRAAAVQPERLTLPPQHPTGWPQLFYLVPAPPVSPASDLDHRQTATAGVDETSTSSVPHMLLTVQEVAETLRCGRTCVYDLIGRGELPAIKLGRLTRIPAKAVSDPVSRRLEDRSLTMHPDVARSAATIPGVLGTLR
jgi:excisionase family DNA binding protein